MKTRCRISSPGLRAGTLAVVFALTSFAQVHVSPTGDDAAAGTAAAPVATLARAVALTREARAANPAAKLKLVLRGGTHRLERTLVLGLPDTPAPGGELSIEAFPGEKPLLSGGVPIRAWARVAPGTEPTGTPAAARGKLWVAELPSTRDGRWNFRTLYDGLECLPRARSAELLARTAHAGLFNRLENRDRLEYPAGAIAAWDNLADVEILSRPNHNWLVNYLGIASIDTATLTLRTTIPATYTPTGKFWIENAMESLDAPGEWVLNTKAGRLYLWPRKGEPGNNIVAPAVTTLVRVEGREDCWGDADRPAGGLRFVGLTFAHTDRDVWTLTDAGLQHDWAMWDKDDACLRFRVARDCEVRDCVFEAAAGQGVRADLFAQNIRIRGCTFRNLGAGGVLLCGYGPGTKDVNHGNAIVDCEFSRLGTLWWHSPAVFLWQSGGNRVANNYIHDLPYNGIVLSGVRPRHFGVGTPKIPNPIFPPGVREDLRLMRWREIGSPATVDATLPYAHTRGNTIVENEIHDAMQVLKDGNGIYLSAAGTGNVLQRNVIYNMGGAAAIRTDDDQSYCSITENVTFGVGIVVKDFNSTWNNIMINGGLRITSDRIDSRVEQNIYAAYIPLPRFYSVDIVNSYFGNQKNDDMLNNYNPNHGPVIPPHTDRNLFFGLDRAAAEAFVAEMQKDWGNDRASKFGDPRFVEPRFGDFRLQAGSPATALGIQSVDTRRVGLLRQPMVERLRTTGGIDLTQRTTSNDRG